MNHNVRDVEHLLCPKCGRSGAATWDVKKGPRKLENLLAHSEGFICLDLGHNKEPFFRCAKCNVDAVIFGSVPRPRPPSNLNDDDA
jgi:uncharacterized C2H2 Zn-finger protein